MGLRSWVGGGFSLPYSPTRATEVAPTLAGKVECSFIYTKLNNTVPDLTM